MVSLARNVLKDAFRIPSRCLELIFIIFISKYLIKFFLLNKHYFLSSHLRKAYKLMPYVEEALLKIRPSSWRKNFGRSKCGLILVIGLHFGQIIDDMIILNTVWISMYEFKIKFPILKESSSKCSSFVHVWIFTPYKCHVQNVTRMRI